MNRGTTAIILALIAIDGTSRAQGTFQNLDFEAAQIVYADSFHVDVVAASALPNWTAYADGNQLSVIQFGPVGVPYPVVFNGQTNGGSIDGNFSVSLSSAQGGGSIVQNGFIPLDAESLFFKAGLGSGPYKPFSVSINGQDLDYRTLSIGPSYILYGAEISRFAGDSATLSFTGISTLIRLDDIQFSSQPIPEPSGLSLILLVGAALGFFRRHAGPAKAAPHPRT